MSEYRWDMEILDKILKILIPNDINQTALFKLDPLDFMYI